MTCIEFLECNRGQFSQVAKMNTAGNSIKNVAVLVGSLRRGSINRKFPESVGKLSANRLRFHFIEIGGVPPYDDLWENPPQSVLRLKREIEAADGVIFCNA